MDCFFLLASLKAFSPKIMTTEQSWIDYIKIKLLDFDDVNAVNTPLDVEGTNG